MDPALWPTFTGPPTQLGVILGTAAYMAPEQAKGKDVDKRADIWGFGCVVYEMLTAQRPFPGEDVTDTIAAVMRGEPDWNALPEGISPVVRQYLKRCFDKNPNDRAQDIRREHRRGEFVPDDRGGPQLGRALKRRAPVK